MTAEEPLHRHVMKPSPYGPFPYSPVIHRPRLNWPGDAQVALWVIPNIEFVSLMEKVPAGSRGAGTPGPHIPSWVGPARRYPTSLRGRPVTTATASAYFGSCGCSIATASAVPSRSTAISVHIIRRSLPRGKSWDGSG